MSSRKGSMILLFVDACLFSFQRTISVSPRGDLVSITPSFRDVNTFFYFFSAPENVYFVQCVLNYIMLLLLFQYSFLDFFIQKLDGDFDYKML